MMAERHAFASLNALMAPRSVAVIGASSEPARIGGRPIASMLAQGFRGRVFPVNPNRAEIQGLPAYASVAALPEVPDAAIVAVPGAAAVQAVQNLAEAGVRAAVVFTAGFAEMDEAGRHEQQRMARIAAGRGMRLLGPNALGAFNARLGYYAFFSASFEGGYPLPGHIGIASQSGAFGSHVFTLARNRGLGTPVCITTGNEADVTVADAIGWLAHDPGTEVIVAYLEGVREGDRFIAALQAAHAARKPVILMKVGRSAVGRRAAQSHTAALAGDDAVFDAVLADYGVVRADHAEELLDFAYAATPRIFPVARTLGVISVSGGAGVQISDAAEALGLRMPAVPSDAQQVCRRLLPFASPLNPVDVTAQALNDIDLFGRFTDVVVEQGGYASVLAFLSQVGGSRQYAPLLCEQLGAARARHPERLWVVSAIAASEQVRAYEARGLLVFEEPARGVRAIAAMARLGQAFGRPVPAGPPSGEAVEIPVQRFNEFSAKAWLRVMGIPCVAEALCRNADEAVVAACDIGYPVVMKIVSADIPHKSEVEGVRVGVADDEGVRDAFARLFDSARRLAPAARLDGVLVARQLTGGVECFMGVHADPVFGPVAVFGIGGIFVELLRDVAMRQCPFDEQQAEAMIRSISGAALLLGARGCPPVDIAALARTLSRLSEIGWGCRHGVSAIDINPVIAMPAGKGVWAVDASVETREGALE